MRRFNSAAQQAVAHIYTPKLAQEKELVTRYTFPFNTFLHGVIHGVRQIIIFTVFLFSEYML